MDEIERNRPKIEKLLERGEKIRRKYRKSPETEKKIEKTQQKLKKLKRITKNLFQRDGKFYLELRSRGKIYRTRFFENSEEASHALLRLRSARKTAHGRFEEVFRRVNMNEKQTQSEAEEIKKFKPRKISKPGRKKEKEESEKVAQLKTQKAIENDWGEKIPKLSILFRAKTNENFVYGPIRRKAEICLKDLEFLTNGFRFIKKEKADFILQIFSLSEDEIVLDENFSPVFPPLEGPQLAEFEKVQRVLPVELSRTAVVVAADRAFHFRKKSNIFRFLLKVGFVSVHTPYRESFKDALLDLKSLEGTDDLFEVLDSLMKMKFAKIKKELKEETILWKEA